MEKLAWELYSDYEEGLNLKANADPCAYFADDQVNVYIEDNAVAGVHGVYSSFTCLPREKTNRAN